MTTAGDECAELIKQVSLDNLVLVNSTAKLDLALASEAPTDMSMFVDGPSHTGHLDSGFGVLYCGVKYRVTLRASEDAAAVVEITAEYAVFYKVPAGWQCSEDGVMEFAGKNGVFNAWPFFRELVHSTAARMGFQPLLLPLYRLPVMPTAGQIDAD